MLIIIDKMIIASHELYPLFAGIISMFIAQFLKVIINILVEKKINIRRFFSAGGMPSSHSALVCGLTTAIGLKTGFTSSFFCISFVFTMVVLYDAAGIRRAVGKQAVVLNQIIDDFIERGEIKPVKLTELLGHTPLEVIMGSILGVIIALIMFL